MKSLWYCCFVLLLVATVAVECKSLENFFGETNVPYSTTRPRSGRK
ncbi:hypothetical protein Phum_PHUM062650 [Pediculus humanus corporis]|uniref:Uncharacterized protein n=1 Tax=Pediculus humanus subsp. corporis TaxID=121224 RepID=E0VBJ2_PEDHC|nr:uncharacterized protein Phum_PHUM062650 [Pediculus humanus corporis]EEB10748.1 hypothetical protein Phum_PHUM062650 [Pediculus humanus corporis]